MNFFEVECVEKLIYTYAFIGEGSTKCMRRNRGGGWVVKIELFPHAIYV